MAKQNKSTKQELINEIYQQTDFHLPPKSRYFLVLILAIVISILGGFLGAATFNELTYPDNNFLLKLGSNKEGENFIPNLSALVENQDNLDLKNAQENFQILGIYKKKASSPNFSDNLVTASDFVSSALAVTSDGWLLSSNKLPTTENFVVLDSQRNQYIINKQVVDGFSGLSLLKINAQNLRPAKFFPEYINAPTNLIVAKYSLNNLGYQAASIEQKNYWPGSLVKEIIHNSDRLDHYIRLNKSLDKSYDGAILIDDQGQVVGLVQQAVQSGLAVPNYYASLAWKKFLEKSEKIIHSSLGVSYLNLSEVSNLDPKLFLNNKSGAYIYSDNPKVPAMVKDSAAAIAGIMTNDLIIKVNDDLVSDANSLTRLIQQYNPGSKVDLTIIRQGKEIVKSVVLE